MTSPFLSPTFIGETLLKSQAIRGQGGPGTTRSHRSKTPREWLEPPISRRLPGTGDFSQKRGIFLSHPQHPTFATIRKRRSCGHEMQKLIGRNLFSMVDEMKPDIPNPILPVTLQLNKKWPGWGAVSKCWLYQNRKNEGKLMISFLWWNGADFFWDEARPKLDLKLCIPGSANLIKVLDSLQIPNLICWKKNMKFPAYGVSCVFPYNQPTSPGDYNIFQLPSGKRTVCEL